MRNATKRTAAFLMLSSVLLAGCAETGQPNGSAESAEASPTDTGGATSATAPGPSTATATSTEAAPSPTSTETGQELCQQEDLEVTLIVNRVDLRHFQIKNISDSPCIITGGYPEVRAIDESGESLPPASNHNHYDRPLSDVAVEPGGSAWAIFGYAKTANGNQVNRVIVVKFTISLPGNDVEYTVPCTTEFYNVEVGGDSGNVGPIAETEETEWVS